VYRSSLISLFAGLSLAIRPFVKNGDFRAKYKCQPPAIFSCASAVTTAEIRARALSSPGADVIFGSSAARRKASRRKSLDIPLD
jgi:hypothetical protein